MLATCSVDKTVTLWDTHTNGTADGPPQACGNKEMNVGKLYTVNFYPSTPWLLGSAGGGKELALWDMAREATIQKRFGNRVSNDGLQKPVKESEESPLEQQEAFDDMMTPNADEEKQTSPAKSKSKKKKTGNKKKKVHRAGR